MADQIIPPKSSIGDHGHLAMKVVVSTVPIVGGATAEILGKIIKPPLEKRREEWERSVSERLSKKIECGDINIEELGKNETFVWTSPRTVGAPT